MDIFKNLVNMRKNMFQYGNGKLQENSSKIVVI
jgi:hypothetical protein